MSKKTEKEKRAAPISYRPPKGKEAEFHARVAASGLSVNAFITALIFSKRMQPVGGKKASARALAPAARIRDILDELMLTADARQVLLIEEAVDEFDVLRGELMGETGRKP